MEAGEGMVAIVQSLRDAGLAVTLMGGRQRRSTITALNQSSQVSRATHAQASAETGTSVSPAVDMAAQICDDRYTSSYQLAHCRVRPSSPPVELSEFPPQRPEPCRTQGNFEIGTGSGEARAPSLPSSQNLPQNLRNSFTSVDRGALSPASSSRCSASFALSLRKYPASPSAGVSSELVQRLLAYTQAKNFSKSSYHSKSLRSLRNKTESPKQVIQSKDSTYYVQTNTQTKARESASIPKGEEGGSFKEQNKKKKRAKSPVVSGRDVRYKDNHINATYDYLKSTSPRRYSARAADVRYLSDVTRCLRDTLRDICDNRPVVCPNIQRRYSCHRRQHHSPRASSDSSNTDRRASRRMVSTEVPAMSSCEAIRGTYQQTCPSNPKICCYCFKPLPCSCTRSSVQFVRLPTDSMTADDFANNVEAQVFDWLQEVPVYAKDKPKDRSTRQYMANQLVDKLKGLKDDEDFEDKAKAEIAKCVSEMPMWCPGNKEDQELFKKQIAQNLLNKILNISNKVDKFENEISKWVENLNLKSTDSQGQLIDKQNIIDYLVDRLKPLALNKPADTEEYKANLKTEIVDILEGLPIKIDGDKKTYMNKLADKLATQLHTIPSKDISKSSVDSLEDEFQKQIWEWLKDVPEFSNASALKVENNQKLVKSLANKLQKLQGQGIEETTVQEKMQNEINEWLEINTGKKGSLDSKTKNKLAKTLVEKLIDATQSVERKKGETPLNEDSITKQIWDWLDDIPELAGGNQLENQKMVAGLAKKLFVLRSQGKEDSDLEDEILNWLTASFENKGERLDLEKQNYLVDSLLSKITTPHVKEDEQLVQDIWDCLRDTPELDLTSKESKKMVDQLAKKIQELQAQKQGDINKEDIKDEIGNWLDNLPKNTEVQINPKTRNQLMQKLMNVASSTPKQRKRWSKQDNLQQAIFDGISTIIQESWPNLGNNNKNNLQNKISSILSRNIDTVKSGDVNDEIKMKLNDILKQEAQMSRKTAKKVTDDIINKLQNMTLPDPSINVGSDQLKNTIKEEVALILDDSNINSDNRDEIESILTDVLADQVMGDENERLTKDKLISALRDSDIPKEQTEEIATKLINIAKEVSLSHRSQNSSTQFSKKSKLKEFDVLSPKQKEIFQNIAEQEIVDYIQEIEDDFSVLSTKKFKAAAKMLAQRISDIMSDNDTSTYDKRQEIESEISKCFQNLSISTDGSQVSKLADKFQNLAFKASTPKTSLDQGFSFRPRRDSRGSTMSAIDDASSSNKEEEQYMNKIVNIIDSWISDLPIELDTKNGQGFKQVMIRDLAGDIIDRQKYLQLNPEAKTSDEEELEHLKYQVFRWLNKLPDVNELMPSISKTDYLMERVKAVPVPQLIKILDRCSKQRDSYIHHLSQELLSLENEISKWIKAVPSKFHASTSKDNLQQMVKDLAEQIDQLHREEALTETLFDDVVSEWLQKMLKEYNDNYFSSLSEGLKGLLVNKGLISLVEMSMLPRQSSHIVQENLRSFILDWLKEKPLYQRRLSIEKREQEQIVAELSKVLKNIYKASHPNEMHRDNRVLDEIKTHLKKFPMESYLKLDEKFHHSTANDLLENLKMLEMFQDMSELKSQLQIETQAEDILPVLEEWIDSLPLQIRKPSVDNKKLESLKHEFAKTLLMIKRQHPLPQETASEVLKEEINNYLHKFPIEPAMKRDPKFVSDKIDELHNKLLGVQSQLTVTDRPSISVDGLNEVILNWARKLPFQPGKSVEKSSVDKIASKIKDTLSNVLADGFENVKADLEEEVKTFCSRLPLQMNKLKGDYVKELMNGLNDLVQISSPAQKAADVDIDSLKEVILNWAKKLPFQPGKSIEKSIPEVDEVASKIKDTLSNLLAGGFENVKDDLEEEVKAFCRRLPLQINKLKDDYVKELMNGLNDLVQTSSPAQKAADDDVDGLKEVILNWAKNLPFQPGKSIEKSIPEVDKIASIIKDTLSNVIADGFENVKADLEGEVKEFCSRLPLQMNKLKENYVKELMNGLNDLVQTSSPAIKTADVDVDGLKEVILNWAKKLPFQPGKSIAKSIPEVDKIALKIKDTLSNLLADGFENVKADLEEEVKAFCRKLPLQMNKLTDDYVKELMNGLNDLVQTSSPAQKAADVDVDGLKEVILNWAKKLPFQPGKNIEKSIPEVDKIASIIKDILSNLLADGFENVKDDLEEEVKAFCRRLPLQMNKLKDDYVKELMNGLNDLVQTSSPAQKAADDDVDGLKDVILNWAKKLPFQPGKSIEKSIPEVDKIASIIKDTLSNVIADGFENVKANLEEEVKEFCSRLPLQMNKLKGDYVKELMNGLNDLVQTSSPAQKAADDDVDGLKEVILNWAKNLPFQPGKSIEKSIPEVDKIASIIKDTLSNVIADGFENVKTDLEGEVKEFCSKLPLQMNKLKHDYVKELMNGLNEFVQTSSSAQKAADVDFDGLKEVILNWAKNLPFQPGKSIEKSIPEVDKIASKIKDTLSNVLADGFENVKADLEGEVKTFCRRLPLQMNKLKDDYLKELMNGLNDLVQTSSSAEKAADIDVDGLKEVILNWAKKLPFQPGKSIEKSIPEVDKIASIIKDTLSNVIADGFENVKADLLGEVKEFCSRLPLQMNKLKHDYVKELMNGLNDFVKTSSSAQTAADVDVDGLKEVILNWAKNLPFQPGKSIEKSIPEVDKIASIIKDTFSNVLADGFENVKADLQKEVKTFCNRLPLQMNKLKDDYVKELMNELNDFVQPLSPAQPTMTTDSTFSSKSGLKKAADVLYDNIKDWSENLPIQSGNSTEEKEKVQTLKHTMASKLINIIGDLNVNPEIFNDDSLYEDLLNDEIDNLLSKLPPSVELENLLPDLKENLIQKIKEAKIIIQDELAGQAYKQQLRDAISKTLPSVEELSTEELSPFEVLKDNLADAYINLHYAAGNEEMKSQLKNKISDDINQFCNDYLQRYPASPIDPKKLNRELYNVLQKVPAPKDETIKTQVEQVRIKDEINDWLKEISLKEDQSPADQLQRNKIVTILAKRLHDIENEKKHNPYIDSKELMQNEIKKWIKKLSIKPGRASQVEEMIKQLTSKLQSTEESRKFSVSNIRHSIDTPDDVRPREGVCPFYSKFDRPADQPSPSNYNRYLSQFPPPSTLSLEDKAHLEKIRERNRQKQPSYMPDFPQCECKDASVNPIPMDAGSQTDVGPGATSGSAKSIQSQIGPSCQASSSQAPVSPQVIVKEYFWDSPDTTMREPSYAAPCGQQQQLPSLQAQNQSCRQQPQPPQFLWPQPQVNITPRYGQIQPPSPCLRPQGTFPSPDQTRMAQAPCMMSPPPMTMQPPYMPQQPRQPQPPCMSQRPQISSQVPLMSHSQIGPPQSPCMSQPYPSAPPSPMVIQSPSMSRRSPCMMSKQSTPPHMRSPYANQPQLPNSPSPYMNQYDKTQCMSTPRESQPQMPPCQSQGTPDGRSQPSRCIPPYYSQENQRRETRKPFRQPIFGTPEVSSTSSPFDTGPDADNGRCRYSPKVTRLGSLDDFPCTKNCGTQSPCPKRSRESPNEDYDWTIRFPEDKGFWGTPCPRRRVHRSPNKYSEGTVIKEKTRKEEKMRCRCQERTLTKCQPMGRRPQNYSCQLNDDSMKHCSKCCGTHCPHPSYLFFK